MALLKKLAWRDQSWAPQKGPTPIVELEKTRPTRVEETTDSAHMLLGPVLGGGTGPFGELRMGPAPEAQAHNKTHCGSRYARVSAHAPRTRLGAVSKLGRLRAK